MVATIREGLMAIDHIGNGAGFVVGSSCEQRSISSEVSNPRQERKDPQLHEMILTSINIAQVVIMDNESPEVLVATPPLSPVAKPTNANNTTTHTSVPVSPQQSPQTPPTMVRGVGEDGLPKLIDGCYPQQQQQRNSKSNPQNTNDSRKLFVGGLPKDGRCNKYKNCFLILMYQSIIS